MRSQRRSASGLLARGGTSRSFNGLIVRQPLRRSGRAASLPEWETCRRYPRAPVLRLLRPVQGRYPLAPCQSARGGGGFRLETGEPLAVMDGRLITEIRTAASAVATKAMAAPGAAVLAVLGTGVQARARSRRSSG